MANYNDHGFCLMVLPNGVGPTPDIMKVSICVCINTNFSAFAPDSPNRGDGLDSFFNALCELPSLFGTLNRVGEAKTVTVNLLNSPSDKFTSLQCKLQPHPYYQDHLQGDWQGYASGIKGLWQKLFPPDRTPNPASYLAKKSIGPVKSLFGQRDDHPSVLWATQSIRERVLNWQSGGAEFHGLDPKLDRLFETFKNCSSLAKSRVYTERIKRLDFIYRIFGNSFNEKFNAVSKLESTDAMFNFAMDLEKSAFEAYVNSSSIDIDEVISTYSALSSHPFLMRLFGLIVDGEIQLPEGYVPTTDYNSSPNSNAAPSFYLQFAPICPDGSQISLDANCFITQISGIKKGGKYAYLVREEPNSHFQNSLLSEDGCELINFDRVAKEMQSRAALEREQQTGAINLSEVADNNPRGIIYTNKYLHEIIKPVDTPSDLLLSEEHVSSGLRVAAQITSSDPSRSGVFSLTKQDVEFVFSPEQKGDPIVLIKRMSIESCIHIDSPVETIFDNNAADPSAIGHVTGDAVFEYSGQLLKLKSAFSKANKTSKLRTFHDSLESVADESMQKAKTRLDKYVAFDSFPFVEPITLKPWTIKLDLPAEYRSRGPKLRENNTYSFPVYREYLNGYALPLTTSETDISIGVLDLYNNNQKIQFALNNNYRPVVLLHTENHEDAADKRIGSLQPLKTLIIRSGGACGIYTSDSQSRHVLPEKIPLEHAFWKDVVSPPNMSPEESFKWKNKYNCPFMDEDAFKARKDVLICPEGCREYCGGTAMAKFHTEETVLTNYLCDPAVDGFEVRLYWDKDYKQPVTLPAGTNLSCNYSINKESQAESRRLTIKRLHDSLNHGVRGKVHGRGIDIHIKPGMTLYAKIFNTIDKSALAMRTQGVVYWWDYLSPPNPNKSSSAISTAYPDLNNPPQEVVFVHAVDRPLVCPKILNLCSIPVDHKQIAHLGKLFHGKYCQFSMDKNVIALRTHMDTFDSQKPPSLAKFDLTAHFERLDAHVPNHFLENVIPTGGLELWMRKEEYIDDPSQVVSDTPSSVGQSPENPVHRLDDPANQFTREFSVEFNGDVLSQLKSAGNAQRIHDEWDLYKAFISRLLVEVDVKSRKFELREYYLRGTSKFGGYFASDKSEPGNCSLPDPSAVLSDPCLRFKVLLLNNAQPAKPAVISVVTSIRELRRYHDSEHFESTQSGNIVTIYLERGRLDSGGGERVAVLVDSNSRYNRAFKNAGFISRAGRDIVSDIASPRMSFLQFKDIVIPPGPLNYYDAKYNDELGLYHYLPVFDIERQCWKFEVELDIKTADGLHLHNPFVNFVLLHYQPFSINYNTQESEPTLLDIQNDCRLSDPIVSCWGQLLPERNLSIHFSKPQWLLNEYGKVKMTISFDITSLNWKLDDQGKRLLRSNFIVSIEGTDDRIEWQPVSSCMIVNGTEGQVKQNHPLISDEVFNSESQGSYEASIHLKFKRNLDFNDKETRRFSHFRVRLVEVEWFNDVSPDFVNNDIDILNDERLRVRYVELAD